MYIYIYIYVYIYRERERETVFYKHYILECSCIHTCRFLINIINNSHCSL